MDILLRDLYTHILQRGVNRHIAAWCEHWYIAAWREHWHIAAWREHRHITAWREHRHISALPEHRHIGGWHKNRHIVAWREQTYFRLKWTHTNWSVTWIGTYCQWRVFAWQGNTYLQDVKTNDGIFSRNILWPSDSWPLASTSYDRQISKGIDWCWTLIDSHCTFLVVLDAH